MREENYYEPVRAYLESLLAGEYADSYFEVTARGQFSNTLKAQVAKQRDIVFHFLRQASPDITGFIKGQYVPEFVVVEVKNAQIKLDDVYQARKYAELLDARYALLVSTLELPEELKRLSKVAYSLLALPGSKTLTLAQFDTVTKGIIDWFPKIPFEH